MKPHKHAELIKAWADGAEIESQRNDGTWVIVEPAWSEQCEYRIKPESKPDIESYLVFSKSVGGWMEFTDYATLGGVEDELRIVRDGKTNKIKSVEIIV